MKAWDRMACDDLIEVILNAVDKQTRYVWIGKERKYIPHPSSWINGGRWDDDVEVPDEPLHQSDAPQKPFDPLDLPESIIGMARFYNFDPTGLTADQVAAIVWSIKYGGVHDQQLNIDQIRAKSNPLRPEF